MNNRNLYPDKKRRLKIAFKSFKKYLENKNPLIANLLISPIYHSCLYKKFTVFKEKSIQIEVSHLMELAMFGSRQPNKHIYFKIYGTKNP
jgi:hypothetical protein